ncbi:helitron_like_N domain-containing protein [Caerostris extrusa]|uniref:Helitron_like_N domain-containing protein n=1 Tax=Caerostris extrusa TaxID=172846 RepID=A0AAV4XL85_CAEEX|nr:helitron_like_N domain-containing protein [Caerostris extrusa]
MPTEEDTGLYELVKKCQIHRHTQTCTKNNTSRQKEDAWVNSFHPQSLRLWTGNMDIQPCGSNEAIAYYIAKYLSKAEPEGVHSGIAQAIQQIQREV